MADLRVGACVAGAVIALTGCSDAARLVPREERKRPVAVAEPPPPAPDVVPHDVAVRVWPLGDSLTYGYGGTPNTEGYRKRLWQWAQSEGFTGFDFVGTSTIGVGFDADQNGHPGSTIADAKHLVWTNYEARKLRDVDLVILLIGTNELDAYDAVAAPVAYEELLEKIIAVNASTTLMVSTIPPSLRTQPNADAFNASLPAIWDRFEAAHGPLLRVDLSAALGGAWSKELFHDRLHPNNAGYDRIAEAMEEPLRPWLLAR